MEITRSQLNYLLAIKRLTGGRVFLTGISEYLGVKKPTASVALKNLEESGYVIKREGSDRNEYVLTEKSREILDELDRERFEFMSLFNDYLGIGYDECDKEYKALYGLFSRDFLSRLADLREMGYMRKESSDDKSCFLGIPYGEYKISFQVVQCGDGFRSMGDKGFIHPARLVLNEEKQIIMLESKKIYYKSKNNQSLRGELSGLYYLDKDMKWVASEKAAENIWIIPVNKILYQKDDCGRLSLGIIKIKAEATTVKMPQSVAEITFNFELIEQIN